MEEYNSNRQTDEQTLQQEVAYSGAETSHNDDSFEMPKRRGSGAGCLAATVAIILVLALGFAVVVSVIKPFTNSTVPPETAYDGGEAAPASSPTPEDTYAIATPVPAATQRPMAEYDGVLPTITDTANPFPEIISDVQHGVVSVYNYGMRQSFLGKNEETLVGSGSGFVISSSGYCVTNAHVISDATRIALVLSDDTEIPCDLIGMDKSTDIAVLKFDNSVHKLKALCLGNSDEARVGEFVITVGDPSGRELAGTITFGIISAVNREVNIDGRVNSYIQTDAAMNPGNSGGPLINIRGEVIGVNSAKTVTASYDEYGNAISAEGLGFAIPVNTVKRIVESLITNGKIVRPGIGLSVRPASEEELYKSNLAYGLYVASVVENGNSSQAGIKEGDILLTCNGKELHENNDLTELVKNGNIGERLALEIYRGGERMTLYVIIGDLNSMG